MPNATGNAASQVPVVGDSYIFHGGDSWHYGNGALATSTGGTWAWSWGGSGGIYLGVDQTWFSGGSWARPILTGDNATSTSFVTSCTYDESSLGSFLRLNSGSNYVTIDNFEFVGVCWLTGGGPEYIYSASSANTHNTVQNNYFHGWTVDDATAQDNLYGYYGSGSRLASFNTIQNNVFDGSDSSSAGASSSHCHFAGYTAYPCYSGGGVYQEAYDIHGNVFRHLSNMGVTTNTATMHDNWFTDLQTTFQASGQHANCMNVETNIAGGSMSVYNNKVTNIASTQCFYLTVGNGGTLYFFNNVLWGNMNPPTGASPNNCIILGIADSGGSGTANIVNNTVSQAGGSGGGCKVQLSNDNSPYFRWNGVVNFQNNDLIGLSSPISNFYYLNPGSNPPCNISCTENDLGNELFRTEAAANAQNYLSTNDYSPGNGGGTYSTAGAGANLNPSCGIFGTALCSGTSDSVTEQSGSGGKIASYPAITVNARPTAWDTGAYQYIASSGGMRMSGNMVLKGSWSLTTNTGSSSLVYSARTDNCAVGTESGCGSTADASAMLFDLSPASLTYNHYLPFQTLAVTSSSYCPSTASGTFNTTATDPDFHSYLIMVTDPCTYNLNNTMNLQEPTDTNYFNLDSSFIEVLSNGGGPYFLYLNTALAHSGNCSPTNPCLSASNIGGGVSTSYTLSGIVGNGTTATATCATNCGALPVGYYVTITGNSQQNFDRIFTVTGVTGGPVTSFTFASTTNATGTGGSANYSFGCNVNCTNTQGGPNTTFSRVSGEPNVIYEVQNGVTVYKLTVCRNGFSDAVCSSTATDTFTRAIWANFADSVNGVLPTDYNSTWGGTFGVAADGSTTVTSAGGGSYQTINQQPGVAGCPSCAISSTDVFILPVNNNTQNMGYQASTGTISGTEPNWHSLCPNVTNTCTDGSVTWTNIGKLTGQGPGFDELHFGSPIANTARGYSRLNTRTAKITRGATEYTPVASGGGGPGVNDYSGVAYSDDGLMCEQYGFAPAVTGTVSTNATTAVTWVSGAQFDTLNLWVGRTITINSVAYLVATENSATSLTLKSAAAGTGTFSYSISPPPASGVCSTNIPFTEYFTIHDGSNVLDSQFSEITETGGGSNGPGPLIGGQTYSPPGAVAACLPTNVSYYGPYSASWGTYPNHAGVFDPTHPANMYVCQNVSGCSSAPPTGWLDQTVTGGPIMCYNSVWNVDSGRLNACYIRNPIGNINAGHCPGHEIHAVYNYGDSNAVKHIYNQRTIDGYTNPWPIVQLVNVSPQGDQHGSGQNDSLTNPAPMLGIANTDVPTQTYALADAHALGTAAGYTEYVGAQTSGSGIFYRFNHNFSSGIENDFAAQNNLSLSSQDGKWAMVPTDMMGTRGSRSTGTWQNNHHYVLGTSLQPLNPTNNSGAYDFVVMIDGTSNASAASEPNWNTCTPTCTDGTVTWERAAGSCNTYKSSSVWNGTVYTGVQRFAPALSSFVGATVNLGDTVMPVGANDLFLACGSFTTGTLSCNGGTPGTPSGAAPAWQTVCPNYGNLCTYASGGPTFVNIGQSDCRADIMLVDLLSAH